MLRLNTLISLSQKSLLRHRLSTNIALSYAAKPIAIRAILPSSLSSSSSSSPQVLKKSIVVAVPDIYKESKADILAVRDNQTLIYIAHVASYNLQRAVTFSNSLIKYADSIPFNMLDRMLVTLLNDDLNRYKYESMNIAKHILRWHKKTVISQKPGLSDQIVSIHTFENIIIAASRCNNWSLIDKLVNDMHIFDVYVQAITSDGSSSPSQSSRAVLEAIFLSIIKLHDLNVAKGVQSKTVKKDDVASSSSNTSNAAITVGTTDSTIQDSSITSASDSSKVSSSRSEQETVLRLFKMLEILLKRDLSLQSELVSGALKLLAEYGYEDSIKKKLFALNNSNSNSNNNSDKKKSSSASKQSKNRQKIPFTYIGLCRDKANDEKHINQVLSYHLDFFKTHPNYSISREATLQIEGLLKALGGGDYPELPSGDLKWKKEKALHFYKEITQTTKIKVNLPTLYSMINTCATLTDEQTLHEILTKFDNEYNHKDITIENGQDFDKFYANLLRAYRSMYHQFTDFDLIRYDKMETRVIDSMQKLQFLPGDHSNRALVFLAFGSARDISIVHEMEYVDTADIEWLASTVQRHRNVFNPKAIASLSVLWLGNFWNELVKSGKYSVEVDNNVCKKIASNAKVVMSTWLEVCPTCFTNILVMTALNVAESVNQHDIMFNYFISNAFKLTGYKITQPNYSYMMDMYYRHQKFYQIESIFNDLLLSGHQPSRAAINYLCIALLASDKQHLHAYQWLVRLADECTTLAWLGTYRKVCTRLVKHDYIDEAEHLYSIACQQYGLAMVADKAEHNNDVISMVEARAQWLAWSGHYELLEEHIQSCVDLKINREKMCNDVMNILVKYKHDWEGSIKISQLFMMRFSVAPSELIRKMMIDAGVNQDKLMKTASLINCFASFDESIHSSEKK